MYFQGFVKGNVLGSVCGSLEDLNYKNVRIFFVVSSGNFE